jgi:hypothetical protein
LTEFERPLAAKADTPLFRAVYGPNGTDGAFSKDDRVAAHPAIHDLSGALADVEDGVYSDEHHLSERGNAHIARALAAAVRGVL